ncbi:MAG: hypothetical protein JO128_04670 [Alphaproteobacteria bacterium]|nr:hypothetical protein [Alphaproteobacteria bacterium]
MERLKKTALLVALCIYMSPVLPGVASAETIKIVAFGDSMTWGSGKSRSTGMTRGVSVSEAYPAKLERALRAKGWDVSVSNQGVPGRTSAAGLSAVDESVPAGTALTIVQLGLNDYGVGVPPADLAANLAKIVDKIHAKGSAVILISQWFRTDSDHFARAIQSADAFASWFNGLWIPGSKPLVIQREFDSGDGEHPNAAFIDVFVERAIPDVDQILRQRGLKPS